MIEKRKDSYGLGGGARKPPTCWGLAFGTPGELNREHTRTPDKKRPEGLRTRRDHGRPPVRGELPPRTPDPPPTARSLAQEAA